MISDMEKAFSRSSLTAMAMFLIFRQLILISSLFKVSEWLFVVNIIFQKASLYMSFFGKRMPLM
jgi:hypothetical protein